MRTSIPIQIRFGDVDMAHHVHNAVYLHWFESARMAFLRAIIPAGHDWSKEGLVVARNEIDHRMPVYLDDKVETEAWCSAIGTKSFDLRYTVRRTSGRKPGICAEGRSVMVCIDHTKDTTMDVPAPWRDKLQELLIP